MKVGGTWLDDNDLKVVLTEKEAERLETLVEDAVSMQGAINWSGIYMPSTKLVNFIMRIFRKRESQIMKLIEMKRREEELTNRIQQLEKELETEKHFYEIYQDVRMLITRETTEKTIEVLAKFCKLSEQQVHILKMLIHEKKDELSHEEKEIGEIFKIVGGLSYGTLELEPQEYSRLTFQSSLH